jgi:hypothetical protein
MPELAGRTEPVIFGDALKANGITTSEAALCQAPPRDFANSPSATT